MLSRLRGRLTYANVIATIALFAALGGTSYAALKLPKNSVGSKQIRKNAVTSAKVKAGSLLTNDFKASQRRGLRGPSGSPGKQGVPGPVTGNLPSGATVRGVYNLDFVATVVDQIEGGSISFGLRLSRKPTVSFVPVGGPPTSNCPGTPTLPEAAPGVLCLYKVAETNTNNFAVCDQDCNPGVAERDGALQYLHATTTGRTFSSGAWAVRAP
jgi:hypothetical protein